MSKKGESSNKICKSNSNQLNQIKCINTCLHELDTFDDKYEKANSSESDISYDKYSNIEYTKSLQISLKESINQNDILNEEINKVINENKILKEEIEEKNKAILELGQYYQYCLENHFSSNSFNNIKNKRNDNNSKNKIKKKRKQTFDNINNKNKDEICEIIYLQ